MGVQLFSRSVGLLVAATAASAATLLWVAVASDEPVAGRVVDEGLLLGA